MKRKFPAFLVITLLLMTYACKKEDIKETTLTKEFNGLAYVVPDSMSNTQYAVAVPVAKNDWLGIFTDKGIDYDYSKISNMGFGDLFIRNVDGANVAKTFDCYASADLFLRYEDGTEEQAATVASIPKGTTELKFTGLGKNLKSFLDKPKFYAVIKMNKIAKDGTDHNMVADMKVNILVLDK